MQKLIEGIRQFQSSYVPSHKALIEELSKGQHPRVLFIGCSDSRVSPEIITQSEIGDLFIIRNAGNIIPPFEATNGGEGATIEYAIEALGIKQVIVCGHSQCGAMKGLLQIGELEDKMPLVYDWLRYADATRKLVADNYGHLDKKERLDALVAENAIAAPPQQHTRKAIAVLPRNGTIDSITRCIGLVHERNSSCNHPRSPTEFD
jgi:carbonic anhydrase